jgi:hypothetical protein
MFLVLKRCMQVSDWITVILHATWMHSLLSTKTKYCVSIKVGRCDNRYPLDPFNDCLSSISRNAFTNEYLSKMFKVQWFIKSSHDYSRPPDTLYYNTPISLGIKTYRSESKFASTVRMTFNDRKTNCVFNNILGKDKYIYHPYK